MERPVRAAAGLLLVAEVCAALVGVAAAQDAGAPGAAESTTAAADAANPAAAGQDELKQPKPLPPPKDAKPFPGSTQVWVDRDKHAVYANGNVSLRRGVLEMFACPKGTKEHESVVALDCKAYHLHAALLLAGAEPGKPVSYKDEYIPPSGDVIDVSVQWVDPEGKQHTASAKEWVRDARTGKAMAYDWVFAGSGFWKDEETGQEHYMAEGGDLICVANFSTAMLDVAAESTQANEGLLFEAFTEHVPALGTPVRVVLTPKKAKESPGAKPDAGEKAPDAAQPAATPADAE